MAHTAGGTSVGIGDVTWRRHAEGGDVLIAHEERLRVEPKAMELKGSDLAAGHMSPGGQGLCLKLNGDPSPTTLGAGTWPVQGVERL